MIALVRIAVGFLTRLPAGDPVCTAKDVGRSARWFPLAGAILGGIYLAAFALLRPFFPPMVIAVLVTALDAFLTGAMHLDGLADTADGFGGGRTRDDVLRIMRDHAIGSFGACALIVAIAFRIAASEVLISLGHFSSALFLAPVLGRWSAVVSATVAGYARPSDEDGPQSVGLPARFIGRTEVLVATFTAAIAVLAFRSWRAGFAMLAAAAATLLWTMACRRRIGGITGDTLGAGIVLSESLVLLAFTGQAQP